MASEPLVQACEVAFEVARRGWEANPPVEPPAPMRSFIYLPQLPPRALIVAQRVVDEDSDFRELVAAAATEDRVGRAGWLWLHRPAGWEADLEILTVDSPAIAPPMPVPPPPPPSGSAATAPPDGAQAMSHPLPAPPPPPPKGARGESPRELIALELASLRTLVDELADERQSAGDAVDSTELGPLEHAVSERDAALADRDSARAERDTAQAVQRRLEGRVVTLESQLRQAVQDLDSANRERDAAQADGAGAIERCHALEAERQAIAAELEAVVVERDAVAADRDALVAERDALVGERDAAIADAVDLRAERARLAQTLQEVDHGRAVLEAELAGVSGKWQRLQVDASQIAQRSVALEAELDQLRRVRESADAERRQLLNDLVQHLGRVEAERDLLASQLDVANARLLGTRHAIDAATQTVRDELDSCEGAFDASSQAARAMDTAVSEAARTLDLLTATSVEAVSVEAVSVEAVSVEAVSVEAVSVEVEDAGDAETGDDDTDLDAVLASYGLGAVEITDALSASAPGVSLESGAASESDDTVSRAQIPPVTGDPLTVARHAVTTEEVVLLIDGDPVAAMGWPMLSPIERRDALVGNLGDLVGDTGAAVDVVFDGSVASEEPLPNAPAVRVRLTSSDLEPSKAIPGLVDAYPLQWPVAVVTDDPTLAAEARSRGASVLDNGQLLDLFIVP